MTMKLHEGLAYRLCYSLQSNHPSSLLISLGISKQVPNYAAITMVVQPSLLPSSLLVDLLESY